MNPKKAIEILTLITNTPPSGANPDFVDAIKLGVEALDWKLTLRRAKHPHGTKKLPSETEA